MSFKKSNELLLKTTQRHYKFVRIVILFLPHILHHHVCLHFSINCFTCFPFSKQNINKRGIVQGVHSVLCLFKVSFCLNTVTIGNRILRGRDKSIVLWSRPTAIYVADVRGNISHRERWRHTEDICWTGGEWCLVTP